MTNFNNNRGLDWLSNFYILFSEKKGSQDRIIKYEVLALPIVSNAHMYRLVVSRIFKPKKLKEASFLDLPRLRGPDLHVHAFKAKFYYR